MWRKRKAKSEIIIDTSTMSQMQIDVLVGLIDGAIHEWYQWRRTAVST